MPATLRDENSTLTTLGEDLGKPTCQNRFRYGDSETDEVGRGSFNPDSIGALHLDGFGPCCFSLNHRPSSTPCCFRGALSSRLGRI